MLQIISCSSAANPAYMHLFAMLLIVLFVALPWIVSSHFVIALAIRLAQRRADPQMRLKVGSQDAPLREGHPASTCMPALNNTETLDGL